jgi:hypothetical protein
MTESHSVRKKKQPTYQVKINLLAKHFLVDAYKVKNMSEYFIGPNTSHAKAQTRVTKVLPTNPNGRTR